jgi:hypothetical protein
VICDFCWDALVIDHPDQTHTREIVHTVCDSIRHGHIGSQLPRLAVDAGLIDVQVEGYGLRIAYEVLRQVLNGPLGHAQQQGRVKEAEVAKWWRPLHEANARNQFMAMLLTCIITGTVPT